MGRPVTTSTIVTVEDTGHYIQLDQPQSSSTSSLKLLVQGSTQTMRAIVHDAYGRAGDVLRARRDRRARDRRRRGAGAGRRGRVDRGAWHCMTGLPYAIRLAGFGVRAPKASEPGPELRRARSQSVGKNVTTFKPGDEVFGTCDGSFAEYAPRRADMLAPSRRTSPSSRRPPSRSPR